MATQKKIGIQIPAWKRKYNEAYFAAGNKIPDGKTARGYNGEFADNHKIPYGTVASHYSKMTKEHPPLERVETASPLWKEKVIEDIQGGHIPLNVASYIKRIVEEYGASYGTINTYYYKILKEAKERERQVELPQPKEEAPISKEQEQDEKYAEMFMEVKEALKPEPEPEPIKPPLHPGYTYRRGSIIKVKVRRIEPGYVIVETLDEHKLPGMIHISQVSNTFISDINKWFKLGLELSAQVTEFTEVEGGKLILSTRNLPFTAHSWRQKPPRADFQEQLNQAAEQLFKDAEEIATTTERNEPDMEQEWKQAKPFIESIIGPVTEAAETEMRKIMKESGVFAFTVALMGKKDNFTPDIGLMLAQAIRKDMSPAEKEFPR